MGKSNPISVYKKKIEQFDRRRVGAEEVHLKRSSPLSEVHLNRSSPVWCPDGVKNKNPHTTKLPRFMKTVWRSASGLAIIGNQVMYYKNN